MSKTYKELDDMSIRQLIEYTSNYIGSTPMNTSTAKLMETLCERLQDCLHEIKTLS